MRKEWLWGAVGLVLGAAVFGAVRTNAQAPLSAYSIVSAAAGAAWKIDNRTGAVHFCQALGSPSATGAARANCFPAATVLRGE